MSERVCLSFICVILTFDHWMVKEVFHQNQTNRLFSMERKGKGTDQHDLLTAMLIDDFTWAWVKIRGVPDGALPGAQNS